MPARGSRHDRREDDPTSYCYRWPLFSLRSFVFFVLLAACGLGLWSRWEPWVPGEAFQPAILRNYCSIATSADGARVFHCRGKDQHSELRSTEGSTLLLLNDSYLGAFLDDDTLEVQLLVNDFDDALPAIQWHRRRPERWWGLAWLWEFWATVVLGGALVWSLWRDGRRFKTSCSMNDSSEPTNEAKA